MRLAWSLFLCVLVSLAPAAFAGSTFGAPVQLGFNAGDDWEPALAVDGNYTYAFWMHFGSPLSDCSTVAASGAAYMAFSRSTDGGLTWSAPSSVWCPPLINGADAQLRVDPASHRLYASWMNGQQSQTGIYVAWSDDYGATWSAPVVATGGTSNGQGGDKDILLVNGKEVWVGYEHLTASRVAHTPDIETTPFTQVTVPTPNGLVSLATSAARDTHGNVFFAWSGQSQSGQAKGSSTLYLTRSSNGGATWSEEIIDTSAAQPQISGEGWDFFGPSLALAIIQRAGSPTDRLVAVYNKGLTAGAAERIYTQYSDDLGASWHGLQELSGAPQGAFHGFASAAADAAGVRVIWMDNGAHPVCTSASTEGGCGTWNIWYRTSLDGTSAWSAEQRIDTETPTHSDQSPAGFDFPYGDYTSLVLDGSGNALAAWGEGPDYTGRGNVYFVRQ